MRRGQTRVPRRSKTAPIKKKLFDRAIIGARDFIILFIDTSSIHGFSQITARHRHPSETVLWALAVIAASWGAISLSLSTWSRFQRNPTVVSLERNYQEWNTSFPSISICPDAKFDSDVIEKYVENRYKTSESKNEIAFFIEELCNSTLLKLTMTTKTSQVKPEDYWRCLDGGKLPFRYNVSNSNIDMYGILTLTPTITEVGICYAYNSAVAMYNDPEFWGKNNWTYVRNIPTFMGSPLDGDIFAQVMNMNSGYKLYVHSPWEVPDAVLTSIPAENNSYKTLDLTAQSIYSTPETEGLTVAQRKCRFPRESQLEISPVYTYNLCRMECRMKEMLKQCGCVPHYYRPLPEKYKICAPQGLQCLENNKDHFIKLRDKATGVKAKCDCVPQCNEVNYEVDTDNTMAWNLGTNLKWGLVKYPKLRLKRDILFGWSDLLVAIGGTAGLFLGCSLLSFAEIFYFFTLRLLLFILRRSSNK